MRLDADPETLSRWEVALVALVILCVLAWLGLIAIDWYMPPEPAPQAMIDPTQGGEA